MLKQKTYNISETNIALLGSDLEKQVKHHAALGEPAWKNAGKTAGIEIWRVNNFKIEPVPKEQYGHFYEGDSYIILHTIKGASGQLSWDVYFWLGEFTTQDEAGTAAYKTVELDDFLEGGPVQHRELHGHESQSFLALFKSGLRILKGGHETGFKHHEPEKYRPRLLHIQGTSPKHIRVVEVPLQSSHLSNADVFILDNGLSLWQFNGKKSSGFERSKAAELVRAIDDERGSKVKVNVIAEDDSDVDEFWNLLGGKIDLPDDPKYTPPIQGVKVLYKLSDESGSLKFSKIAEGKVPKHQLKSEDVFILDSGFEVIAWVGQKASVAERRTALQYAIDYVKHSGLNKNVPVSRVLQGAENELFYALFD